VDHARHEPHHHAGAVEQLVGRVDNITADVQAGKGTVGKLLADPATADELKTLLVKANHSMDELQVTLNNLQQASTNLPRSATPWAWRPKIFRGWFLQTRTSMRELERLVEAMQRTWLLRKYVNQTNPPPSRPLPETAMPEKKPLGSSSRGFCELRFGLDQPSPGNFPKCTVGLHPIAQGQPTT